MEEKRSYSSSRSKKRPLPKKRPGVPSLDQFHSQLQAIVMAGVEDDLSSTETSIRAPAAPTTPLPSIRFTESAVLGLREIFGTYLQHVASNLSEHDSLTLEETVVECLKEITKCRSDDRYTDGRIPSSLSSTSSSSPSNVQWQDLPLRAKELLAEVAAEAKATNHKGSMTTSTTPGTDKPEDISSLAPYVLPPGPSLRGSSVTTETVGSASGSASMWKTATGQRKQTTKRRKRMVVTEGMEADQERLLMASKQSMAEKQREESSIP